MDETQTTLDRLERRIEEQAARIDALQLILERNGIFPRPLCAARADEVWEIAKLPVPERKRSRIGRGAPRLRLGTATGV
jgi:hypothetical protein